MIAWMHAKRSSKSVGRNRPCPCGSGKKYKKCCLKAQRQEELEAVERWDAFEAAFRWLYRRYPEEVDEAIEARLAALVPRAVNRWVGTLSLELADFWEIQDFDWLVAEGTLEIGGESVKALDLFLDNAEDQLSPAQRRWLEAAAGSKIELFEMVDATPDLLRIRPARPLAANDVIHDLPRVGLLDGGVLEELQYFGARLVPWKGGARATMGLYPFFAWVQDSPYEDLLPDLPLEIEGDALVAAWLHLMANFAVTFAAEDRRIPPEDLEGKDLEELWELIQESEEPEWFQVHETDVFQVLDWYGLEEALAMEEHVVGGIRNGWLIHASETSEEIAAILDVHWKEGEAKNLVRLLKAESDDPGALRDWLSKTAGPIVRWLWRADGLAE